MDTLIVKRILLKEEFEDFEIETSLTFKTIHSETVLPKLFWAKVPRIEGVPTFFLNEKNKLIVNEEILELLSTFNLSDSEIEVLI
jgi:hypothetical protein